MSDKSMSKDVLEEVPATEVTQDAENTVAEVNTPKDTGKTESTQNNAQEPHSELEPNQIHEGYEYITFPAESDFI
jgi:hypothetical protein